jgi:hypothetical protein
VFEDAVSKIPERFSKKVLKYTNVNAELKTQSRSKPLSEWFPHIWDRVIEYMRYEDDIDFELMGDLSFAARGSGESVTWKNITRPLQNNADKEAGPLATPQELSSGLCRGGCGRLVQPGLLCGKPYDTCCRTCAMHPPPQKILHDRCCKRNKKDRIELPAEGVVNTSPSDAAEHAQSARKNRLKLPDIFREKHPFEIFVNHYGCAPDPSWPENPDVQWRMVTLARNLGLPIPRPFQAPYIPGLTVLIPHYGESIILREKELWWEDEFRNVALIDWLKRHWDEEFKNFHARKQANLDITDWPATGNQWDEYTDQQWEALSVWSSMRMQTLWRTVAGMCLYHPALQLHYEAQAKKGGQRSLLALKSVWDPSDCFTCLVSMQMYKFFGKAELTETNRMFRKFPSCLKVAFIDCEEKGNDGDIDAVHQRQRRRYFSCLIDKDSEESVDGRRHPQYRIELPGYPILGDGKSDNQNHAIPFMRGTLSQCIDANQGAYFEQMLLLPCVLGEFRSEHRGDGGGKKIIGFPEHITSDIGSVGDMAASAEVAFGTILQRTYSVLGARMHYGHPDIMNKQYMMQQGGVSKATKTLNLSEDIFAGMDFTLRGQGREIKHCEYFHLSKGRDLGFNTVLGFFSKISSGAGEQILTRQMLRIGHVFHLPDFLTFHYAHVGYYLNQFLVSWALPCFLLVWLMVLVSECDVGFEAFQNCHNPFGERTNTSAQIMASLMSAYFSWLLLLFLVATSLPLFAEVWIERSLKKAAAGMFKQMLTLSPLLFIFQAKVIGYYVVNELRFGGATYVSTGRGLPTDRRWFIGEPKASGCRLAKVGGLYLDYAQIAYYDGFMLLVLSILVPIVGGIKDTATGSIVWLWVSVSLTITSWLFAPFIFNPYQFVRGRFQADCRAWCAFFFEKRGGHWLQWYETTQLKPKGVHRFAIDITVFFAALLLATLGELVFQKFDALRMAYSETIGATLDHYLVLAPPVAVSMVFSMLMVLIERFLWCCSGCYLKTKARYGKSSVEVEGDVEDPEIDDRNRCCNSSIGMPVAISALLVFLFDVAEAGLGLMDFHRIGWTNAIIAGFMYKYCTLVILIRLGESLLRTRCFRCMACLTAPLSFWIRAHRMCRDLLISFFILIMMLPWVILNSLNDHLCLGCSIHKLLIYRDGGHFAREKLDFNLDALRNTRSFASRWRSEGTTEYSEGERTHRSIFRSHRTEHRSERSERQTEVEGVVEAPLTDSAHATGPTNPPRGHVSPRDANQNPHAEQSEASAVAVAAGIVDAAGTVPAAAAAVTWDEKLVSAASPARRPPKRAVTMASRLSWLNPTGQRSKKLPPRTTSIKTEASDDAAETSCFDVEAATNTQSLQ